MRVRAFVRLRGTMCRPPKKAPGLQLHDRGFGFLVSPAARTMSKIKVKNEKNIRKFPGKNEA